ncbi:MAG: protein translocase subunit SecF [Leptospiraceae bacterium]|nr:protein translocase subunit SecF [Leptospiraceae bacterium]MDW8305700.1 protein translocase subunit SecF [Leptospiraceae bacterium]
MKFSVMKYKYVSLISSLLLLGFTLFYTYQVHGGFHKGIDFAGGVKLEILASDKISLEKLRGFLAEHNMAAVVFASEREGQKTLKLELSGPVEVTLSREAEKQKELLEKAGYAPNAVDYLHMLLVQKLAGGQKQDVQFIHADRVGPTIGRYLTQAAIKVLAVALLLITIYVAFRFKLNFAIGALIASIHDLLLTLGFVGFLQIPLSIPVIAALLTILGYSINDTIVIYDRIRENLHGQEELGIDKVVDKSIYQSLSRTINTSATTILAILPVYLIGGEGLKELALVLIIGIIVGTYSSNFVAAPVVVIWENLLRRKAT